MNLEQLRELVIRPTLQHLELWSEASENLVVGTALVESKAEYLHQVRGPALGIFQMEPDTWQDLQDNYLRHRPDLAGLVEALTSSATITRGATEMIGNLYYAAAMCRIHYRRVREPLPDAKDADGHARYWKKHFNSEIGKGTVERALPYFIIACA